MKENILIQGFRGAYHHLAANLYFNNLDIDIEECLTFEELFQKLKKGRKAICAIENNNVGTIIQNYAMIRRKKIKVVGETYLRIKHCIASASESSVSAVKKVFSHPMALNQCAIFLKKNSHIQKIESYDTALSAKKISENPISGEATICSEYAAKLYGLNILEKEIEDNKTNYTRFLILEKRDHEPIPNKGKASLSFSVSHRKGSLAVVLSIMSNYELNLTKIQSLPIPGKNWKYFFYVDFLYGTEKKLSDSIRAIEPFTSQLEIMGTYKPGKKSFE